VQFQVLERLGGRARTMPCGAVWKDTLLVSPGERVPVIATLDKYRGRFLMHCHDMVHEGMGMMMNYEMRQTHQHAALDRSRQWVRRIPTRSAAGNVTSSPTQREVRSRRRTPASARASTGNAWRRSSSSSTMSRAG